MGIEARAALLAHLSTLVDRGRVAPCLRWPLAWWTAEDPAEQQLAARLCVPCPALTPCRDYGLEHPDEFGVYGGLCSAERHPKRGRPVTGVAA